MTHTPHDTPVATTPAARILGSRWSPGGPTIRETLAAADAARIAAAIEAAAIASGRALVNGPGQIEAADAPPAAGLEAGPLDPMRPAIAADPWGDARSAREGSR